MYKLTDLDTNNFWLVIPCLDYAGLHMIYIYIYISYATQ